MIFKTSFMMIIFHFHYFLILNGNRNRQDLFINIKQNITPFLISPEQINEQNYNFSLTVFCNDYLNNSDTNFSKKICAPNHISMNLKDLNIFLRDMNIQIQNVNQDNQFTLTYLLSFKDIDQIEQKFYYKQNFSVYQKIPLELKNLIITQSQISQDENKVLLLEIKDSYYQLTQNKNLELIFNDTKPEDLQLELSGNKLYVLFKESYKQNTPLKLNFYIKDTKTKFESQNIQVQIAGDNLQIVDDFFYRALFVFLFLIFTLLVIFYIIWQMVNFDEGERINKPEIIVEGGPIEGKVLSDSILQWDKSKKYDNKTTFKGESMFDDDHQDEEAQNLKDKKFKFNIMDEVSVINSKDVIEHRDSFIEEFDIKNIN